LDTPPGARRWLWTLEVLDKDKGLGVLETQIADAAGVYINAGVDEREYLDALMADIRENLCEPYWVQATVMAPGFPDKQLGDTVEGWCVAAREGYWLVYSPEDERFYAFWGTDRDHLGAHGVFGSPMYCWSA
jgi:hypothetical protein